MTTQSLAAAADDRELTPVVEQVAALATRQDLIDPQLIAAAARAWSPNTIRAFRSDLTLWDAWCRRHGVAPGLASGETVAAYVRALAGHDSENRLCCKHGARPRGVTQLGD